MSKRWIKAGATSQTIDIFVLDSSSTIGAGLTGLVFNTAGLTCYYRKGALGTPTAVTLATLALVTTAWATGGFIAVDATNMPGVYRLDIPNVVIDTAGMVTMYLRGATNMAPVVLELEIVAVDIYDTVRLGLTALPNVIQGTSGALPTGNATGQVTVAGTATGAITSTSFAAGAIDASAIATDAITSAELSASAVQEIADGVLSRKLNMAGNISDVSVTSVSSATFTGANTYIAGDTVQFITSAPTSFALATKYYVIATSLTATTFQLSATSGGSAITTVSTGAFTVLPIDDRTVRSALRYVRNKVGISGSTMTVSIEDDATSAWTAALTTSPGVDPVTTLDPA